MQRKSKSRAERMEGILERLRKVLEAQFPQGPHTLEEIERIAEEIRQEVEREVEEEGIAEQGEGDQGRAALCRWGGKAEGGAERRGVEKAQEVIALGDGAAWIGKSVAEH